MNKLFPQDIELMHLPYLKLGDSFDPNKENEIVIQIGRIPHPMEKNHHIKWVEIWQNSKLLRREEFDPLRDKEAKLYFVIPKDIDTSEKLTIKSFCNLDGLYQTQIDLNHLDKLEVEKEY